MEAVAAHLKRLNDWSPYVLKSKKRSPAKAAEKDVYSSVCLKNASV